VPCPHSSSSPPPLPRDWEFSWLSRNLQPIKFQKIHWVAEPGTASYGVSINNRGQVRFVRRPGGCRITLSISYEVPDVLAPFANVGGGSGGKGRGVCRGCKEAGVPVCVAPWGDLVTPW
jgi:hypothetical protein